MMSNRDAVTEHEEFVDRQGKKPVPGSAKYRVFTPNDTIGLDVRDIIQAYVRGERDAPVLRHWVGPHWKHQPYGPLSALRKHIYIEGYYRGVVIEELEPKTPRATEPHAEHSREHQTTE
jgi:hypothetical protein